MATRQQPWASGKHKKPTPGRKRPVGNAAKGFAGRAVRNVKSSYAKATRKHPWINLFLQIVLGILGVVLLFAGLLTENLLYFLATALAALGGVAARRARVLEQERQQRQPRMAKPTAGPQAPPPGSGQPPPAGGLRCSATGRPLDGDSSCDCHSRHVRQGSNAKKLGLRIGDPYGKPKN